MRLLTRDALPSDARIIVSLINSNLSTDRRFLRYYSTPSVDKWNRSCDSGGSEFLRSHIIVEMEKNNKERLTAGYARYIEWHADGVPCGYIRGPWINTSLDDRSRVEVSHFIMNKIHEKMTLAGLSLARAQVPLFNTNRLALFKEQLGFSVINRTFTYSRDWAISPRSPPALPGGFLFSRYSGASTEDSEIIRLHNAVFPRERLTVESFSSLKDKFNGFTNKATIYLLRQCKQLLGMAWVDYRPAPGSDRLSCWIHDLAVRPSFQRQGLGKAMVMHCVNNIKADTVKIAASISTFNIASIRTFDSCGFVLEKNSGMELLEKKLEEDSG